MIVMMVSIGFSGFGVIDEPFSPELFSSPLFPFGLFPGGCAGLGGVGLHGLQSLEHELQVSPSSHAALPHVLHGGVVQPRVVKGITINVW